MTDAIPCAERLFFTTTGSEATFYVLPGIRRFVSAVHSSDGFEKTVRALDAACRGLA